ncbi:ESX secretion-associated protein EspG [Actinokineospora sp.]|uniref:ESX secretion-associated protein EspG n=1 Tax=Actinokineospora sp. TaxID=1872133 RepID=UPI00403817D6
MTVPDADALSPLAMDFLWEALDAGELPYPFETRSHGATMAERALLRTRAHDELRAKGLLGRTGRVEPDIENRLLPLARPDIAIDSVFLPELGAEPVAVLAALSGSTAVVAVQTGAGLRLTPVRPGALVAEVVALLPLAPRGTEPSISLPAEDFAAAPRQAGRVTHGNPSSGRQPDAVGRSTTGETRQALARLVATPNVRGGQLAVTGRDRMGVRKRGPVLSWFDKPTGRYLTTMRRGRDGRDWVTVAPADATTFRHRVAELVAEVTPR